MKKITITQEQIMEVLEKCYESAVNGLPGSKSCLDLAKEYMDKYETPELAVKKLVSMQVAKCSASGFLTSLGGLITLPVAIPANVASVIYVQLRMIATIAVIGGYDVNSDEVQTLVYLCLIGTSISDILKKAGVEIANKTTQALLKKLPGHILIKINQMVGFRLVTKFGEKGIINLGKLVPVAGGVVGGGVDYIGTKRIAKKSYNMFILDKLD